MLGGDKAIRARLVGLADQLGGVDSDRERLRQERDEAIRAAHEAGFTVREIARLAGVPTSAFIRSFPTSGPAGALGGEVAVETDATVLEQGNDLPGPAEADVEAGTEVFDGDPRLAFDESECVLCRRGEPRD